MVQYNSNSGKESGVTAYQLSAKAIFVRFRDGAVYKYSYQSCGKIHVDAMKICALASLGLSTYIAQHQPKYEWKG